LDLKQSVNILGDKETNHHTIREDKETLYQFTRPNSYAAFTAYLRYIKDCS